jgi:hypothetical protein
MLPRLLRSDLADTACIAGFILLLAAIGHDDYGVSADEPALLSFGEQAIAHLFHGGPAPAAADWTFHSPWLQVLLVAGQRALRLTDGMDIWFFRHFTGFLLFGGGVLAFHRLALRHVKHRGLALLGVAMFLLSPRVFAHGFYNPKDVPALALFTLSMLTMHRFLELPSRARGVVHGMCCGLLVGLRPFGLLVPAATVMFLLTTSGRGERRGLLKPAAWWGIAFALMLIASWPALWSNPFAGLSGAITDNTSRPGSGLFMGRMLDGTPWHYLPTWMAITTPWPYTLLFLAGLVAIVLRGGSVLRYRHASSACVWFFGPLVALVVLRIGLFDEWRHVLFVYPAFLLIALEGAALLLKLAGRARNPEIARRGAGVALVAALLPAAWWMLANHPFEYAYFSVPSAWVDGRFELDYWGLSYRPALEHVLLNDKRAAISVYGSARLIRAAADTLPLDEWKRLRFSNDPAKADYLIDNFRWNDYREAYPESEVLRDLTIDGLRILTIYRGPDTRGVFPRYEW